MKRIKFFILILILSGFDTGIVSAVQLSISADTNITDTGRVEIIQDPRIANLVTKHIAINKKQKGIPGYRV